MAARLTPEEFREAEPPPGVVAVPLTRGYVAWIDAEDAAWAAAFTWHVGLNRHTAYAVCHASRPRRTTRRMHREIVGAPPGVEVDHINGNGLDNRRANLRLASHAENMRNRMGLGGRSRFKGVRCRGSRWRSIIHFEGRRILLGTFDTEEQAARRYDEAAAHYFGAFAWLNFPDETPEPYRVSLLRRTTPDRPYRGAHRNSAGHWEAGIKGNGSQRHLGTFPTAVQAAHAYDAALRQMGRDERWANFPVTGRGGQRPLPEPLGQTDQEANDE